MPQMSPLNWSILFITFTIMFIFILNKIYSNYMCTEIQSTQILMNKKESSIDNIMWKW